MREGRRSALAQTAFELPAIVCAGDGDNVEIQPLRRIALGNEHHLAQEFGAIGVVTPRLEHLQILVVQRAAGRFLMVVGVLNNNEVGNRVAGHPDQGAQPSDGPPHLQRPAENGHNILFIHGVTVPDAKIQDQVFNNHNGVCTIKQWRSGLCHSTPEVFDIPFTQLGEFVYHCHILEHEDGGMMARIQVVPSPY